MYDPPAWVLAHRRRCPVAVQARHHPPVEAQEVWAAQVALTRVAAPCRKLAEKNPKPRWKGLNGLHSARAAALAVATARRGIRG